MAEKKVVSTRLEGNLYALVERFSGENNMTLSQAVARLCEIGVLLVGEVGSPVPELVIAELGKKVREAKSQNPIHNIDELAARVRNLENTVRFLMRHTKDSNGVPLMTKPEMVWSD